MSVPDTSSSLLRALSDDGQSARWDEFVDRYRPMMEGFLRSRFPDVERDDVIQETLIALSRILPGYAYDPRETGSFHDYLAAILRNKARDALRSRKRREEIHDKASQDPTCGNGAEADTDRVHRAILKIALQLVLSEPSVLERNKRVFVETAVNGLKPEIVAEMFGISRNNVDQIKARMISRIQGKCKELKGVSDGF